ncbi:hypothetical protein [Spirosoma gilvum]
MAKARIQNPMMDWKTIPWRKLERSVFNRTAEAAANAHIQSLATW